MLIAYVQVRVKREWLAEFIEATLENAQMSRGEAGVFRFELVQHVDDPTRFLLVEGYRDDQAPARHKETQHYQAWRDKVAPFMAEPRSSQWYRPLEP
jgi:autoinducer 2-degrading protein